MTVREQLLVAAARVYGELGYHGATTRRIAVEAGVNEITLFRHFGSKDALLREAISRAGRAGDAFSLPDSPSNPFDELTSWARAYLADLRARSSLLRACMGETVGRPQVIPFENSPPARAAKLLRRYLSQLREAGMASATFDEVSVSAMLMGALFADAMGRDIMPDMFSREVDQAVEEYVRVFLRGIGVSSSSSVSPA
jgi:AcrR family transcriptional regulator